MIGGKLKIMALVVLALATFSTVEWSYVDGGALLGSIAYPDGAAVDVTLNGNEIRFTAILPSGTHHTTSMSAVCASGIDSAVVTANGRAVHLVTQEASCGVEHYRYWIPDEMRDLKERQVFIPAMSQ